jgi:hypothetical protein
LKSICLCFLALCICIGAAAAQGSPLPQAFGMSGGFVDGSFINSMIGLGEEAGLPWTGPEFDNSSSAYSFLSEFYINTSIPVVGGFTPVKFDVTHKTPSRIYFGSGRDVTYTQYKSFASSAEGNELWIQKGPDWSQYAIVPEGTALQLIAFSSAGGQADYFDTLQTDSASVTSKRVSFYSGYNSMSFVADKSGRHILLFVLNNQPSNAIVIDVISEAPPAVQNAVQTTTITPSTTTLPTTNYGGQTTTTGSVGGTSVGSTSYQTYGTTYPPLASAIAGDTPVTIQTSMKGYDIYVDGVQVGKEGFNGDALDGIFRFMVVGGQTHNIRIYDGVNNYEKPVYFEKGVAKVINVPPATTVYTTGGLY